MQIIKYLMSVKIANLSFFGGYLGKNLTRLHIHNEIIV